MQVARLLGSRCVLICISVIQWTNEEWGISIRLITGFCSQTQFVVVVVLVFLINKQLHLYPVRYYFIVPKVLNVFLAVRNHHRVQKTLSLRKLQVTRLLGSRCAFQLSNEQMTSRTNEEWGISIRDIKQAFFFGKQSCSAQLGPVIYFVKLYFPKCQMSIRQLCRKTRIPSIA